MTARQTRSPANPAEQEEILTALLIIDMQVGAFQSTERHDAAGVIARINALLRAVRAASGLVVFIQHDEPQGPYRPGADTWQIIPELERMPDDRVVHKTACDSFYETDLAEVLGGHRQLIVTGCATDFCVDTTVRAAASRDYAVTVASDAHTTADRPHMDAASVIKHHNWLWENLILPRSEVRVLPTADILVEMERNQK
jgi:nicotinamidase-related amidase